MQFATDKATANAKGTNEEIISENLNKLFVDEEAMPLGQEDDEGSVEYKRKLVDPSADRLKHLTTQMQFRLTEG